MIELVGLTSNNLVARVPQLRCFLIVDIKYYVFALIINRMLVRTIEYFSGVFQRNF